MQKHSRSIGLAALVTAGLLAAAVASPAVATSSNVVGTDDARTLSATLRPASTDAAGDEHRDVTVTLPGDRNLVTGEVAHVTGNIDTTQPSTVHFQQDVDGTWLDLESYAVPTGVTSFPFTVPTDEPGDVTVRVVLDADAVFSAWATAGIGFTVTQAPPPPPVLDASTITMTAPSASSAAIGKAVSVIGQVTSGSTAGIGRSVRLELATPNGWLPLGTTITDATGGYRIAVPTDWAYSGKIRVTVTGTGAFKAASSPQLPMRVDLGYRPDGSPTDFRMLTTARWNPCEVITYKVNAIGAPDQALDQVKQAIAQVHQATGLRFSYLGATTAIPYRTDHQGKTLSDADLTIGWGSEKQVRDLRGWTIGLGGPWWSGDQIIQGAVVLDRGARLRPGFGRGQTWGSLLLHEIGHAVGLDHNRGIGEVMHSGLNDRSHGRYQAGDLGGLRKKGAANGCTTSQGSLTSGRLPATMSAVRD